MPKVPSFRHFHYYLIIIPWIYLSTKELILIISKLIVILSFIITIFTCNWYIYAYHIIQIKLKKRKIIEFKNNQHTRANQK